LQKTKEKTSQLVDPEWWSGAGERAVSQFAEAVLPLLLGAVTFAAVDWQAALGVGLGGGIVSLVFSLASLPPQESLTNIYAVVVRLIRTAAAATGGVLGTDAFNVFEFDWETGLGTVGVVT